MNKKHALEEMTNVSADATIGSWTDNQRLIIGVWAGWLQADEEKAVEPKPSLLKRAWAGFNFSKTIKWIVNTVLTILIFQFLFFGAMYYHSHLSGNMNDISQVKGDGVSATCFQSDSGSLSCLPTWLVEQPELAKPKPALFGE